MRGAWIEILKCKHISNSRIVPRLRRAVARPLLLIPVFNPRAVRVGCVVDRQTLGQFHILSAS
jgi:hypothetical protein